MRRLGWLLSTAAAAVSIWYYVFAPVNEPGVISGDQPESFTWNDYLSGRLADRRASRPHGGSRMDQPDQYVQYHWGIRTRHHEDYPAYLPGHGQRELQKARRHPYYAARRAARTQSLPFTERGPSNVPGRTRGLVVLPDDPEANTWLAGSVGGGIWKTRDSGNSWELKTPDLPSLAISWIDLCKNEPQIVYAATGEANGAGRGIAGSGVFKSVDGGESWIQLPSTANRREFTFINRIIVSPDNPDLVLISTSQGEWEREFRSEIYRSADGGSSWQKVYTADSWIYQIIANPANFNTIYAAKWADGALKSVDGGITWQRAGAPFQKAYGRVELAVAPSDSARIYASVQGNLTGAGADLYVSYDAGSSWALVDLSYSGAKVDYFRGQGDYDNTIAVNPYNADEVYFGGVNLWRSTVRPGNQVIQLPVATLAQLRDSLSIWDFVNFGGEFNNGQLDRGLSLNLNEFVDVELRTGPGIAQKAHRFTVGKKGAGVADSAYVYRDYVTVPFEVWDVAANRQLMVSFRDQQEDSVFSLLYLNTEQGQEALHSREYLYIHSVEYGETPDLNIAQNGGANVGHQYRLMYFFWPILRTDRVWDAESPEADKLIIDFDIVEVNQRNGNLDIVSDAYEDFEKINPAYNSLGSFGFHPDHHNLIMIPVNKAEKTFRILNANDGGVFISNTSTAPGTIDGDWTFSGTGYNTGQFYSATKRPGEDQYLGGLQDNGTWRSPKGIAPDADTEWRLVWGGDGFDVLWNYLDGNQYIVSVYNNRFFRTEDDGRTWFNASQGINGIKPFFSKLASNPSNPNRIFTVTSLGVYLSQNFGRSWTLSNISQFWAFSSFMDVKVSRSNYDIVWAGSGMSPSLRLHVSVDGGETFSPTALYDEAELGFLSGMATHPYEDSTAYVLFSFAGGPKILRTTDLGSTWEDISGFGSSNSSSNGFPDVAVYSLLVRPDDPDILWAGTEIGIFESVDNGTTWAYLDNAMGAVAVWDMEVVDDQIIIATHGRGVFTATLPEAPEVPLIPDILRAGTGITGQLVMEAEFRSPFDSTTLFINGNRAASYGSIAPGLLRIDVQGVASGDSISLELTGFRRAKAYNSAVFKTRLFEVNTPVITYTQNFNEGSTDFTGRGFLVTRFTGFDNFAIHTFHPYDEGVKHPGNSVNFTFQLRTPIMVSGSPAIMRYKDIAIVETGEPGTAWPSESFYDYVIVEGSADGINWLPLTDGYDAGKNERWLNAYNQGLNGDKSMYVRQQVDLSNRFVPGDTVFIRFRLYSDPLTAGWGWSIDDIEIQNLITGLEESGSSALVLFPNPAEAELNLRYELPAEGPVGISVIDMLGRTHYHRDYGSQPPGSHSLSLDLNDYRKGVYLVQFDYGGRSLTRRFLKN